eukprot:9368786-Pyramimonas_sp.AAC.1
MQRRSEGSTWVRSTRGQLFKSTRGCVQYVKGGTGFGEWSPVTIDSDVRESQELGSVCHQRGLRTSRQKRFAGRGEEHE